MLDPGRPKRLAQLLLHVLVHGFRVTLVLVGVEHALELRVVRDVPVALEHRQIRAHLGERRPGRFCPVRPAHRDLGRADVDHDRPLGLVPELEKEASVRLAEVESRARCLKVGCEAPQRGFFLRRRVALVLRFEPFVRLSRIAVALDQIEVVAQEPEYATRNAQYWRDEVVARCHAEENPEEPSRSRAEVKAFLCHPPSSETREYWFVESAGECVGFAQLGVMQGAPTGRVELQVHPAHRGHGHGRALLDAVERSARSLGANRLAGRHATEAGARFASAVGAKDTFREVRSMLRLPLSEELAVQPVDGYGLRSWVGTAPAELLESFARARNAINDAPLAFEGNPEVWTADLVRELETAVERRDRDVRVTVALDAASEVVAFTELRVSRPAGAIAGTEDTAVVPEHRRRGLGRWVKVESLRRLQDDRPDVRLVTTANAEQNAAMRSLNRALGFSPVTFYTNCALELSG